MNPKTKSAPSKVNKTTVRTMFVPDDSQLPFHIDTIKCPKCPQIQSAKVVHGWPKYKYSHKCVGCGYQITKKDWKSAQ